MAEAKQDVTISSGYNFSLDADHFCDIIKYGNKIRNSVLYSKIATQHTRNLIASAFIDLVSEKFMSADGLVHIHKGDVGLLDGLSFGVHETSVSTQAIYEYLTSPIAGHYDLIRLIHDENNGPQTMNVVEPIAVVGLLVHELYMYLKSENKLSVGKPSYNKTKDLFEGFTISVLTPCPGKPAA